MTVGEACRLYQDQLEALRTARDRGWDVDELERMVARAEAELYDLWEAAG